jgi:hypothetical protein
MSVYGESTGLGRVRMSVSSLPRNTMSSFQIVGLPRAPFEPLFALPEEALAARGVRRVIASARPGFPCRISLTDAEPGEELLLLPFEHQPANSPYRASGPIYVRVGARPRTLASGDVPEYVTRRQISVRAYDENHMIVGAEVCAGESVGAEIERQFANPHVSYIHLHNAKRGCYSCLVERVAAPTGSTEFRG